MPEPAAEPSSAVPQKTRLALSIRQPWATLVVHGLKTIELRRWRPRRLGSIYVHAGAMPEPAEAAWARLPVTLSEFAKLRRGLVGRVEIIAIKQYETIAEYRKDRDRHLAADDWFAPGLFGWELGRPEIIPYESCPGNLRIFRV